MIEGRKRASTNLDAQTQRAVSAGGGTTTTSRGTFGNLAEASHSTFGLSNFQSSTRPTISGTSGTLAQSNSAGQLRSAALSFNNLNGMSSHSRGGRDRDDTGNTLGGRDRDRTRSYSKQSYDSFQNIVSTVLVVFPDGTQVVVPFKEDTLLLDLLPKIHKLKRLRLYTNEYVFAVSAADQKHLKVRMASCIHFQY